MEIERIKNAKRNMKKLIENYKIKLEAIDINEIKKKIKEIKEKSILNLKEIKEIAIKNLEKRGIKVFEASDREEAKKILKKLIKKNEKVVKSKS
ncbi:MAG: LUD domain-containing protein, partial [Candidatus Aenigmarchaeota archaeon]|nr:LUD domain-containing protein [Candidatus Aenigmarchaeota archaeon]MDW8149267.1 LUD domain-containing protein [Candidatus Aenigmarchaeota archaeon]